MKFGDQFRTGWRNLSRQKLRTSLTIFAIVIGAVSVTVMLSLVTSAKSFMVSSFEKTGEIKRVVVTGTPGQDYRESLWNWPDGSGTKIDQSVLDKVAKVSHVKSATLYVSANFFESMKIGNTEVSMKNIGMTGYTPNGTIKHVLSAGSELTTADIGKGALVSQKVANDLGFKDKYEELLGKTIELKYRGDMGPPEAGKTTETITVVGVMTADGGEIDVDLGWLEKMGTFSWDEGNGQKHVENQVSKNGYSSVVVDVDEKANVEQVIADITKLGIGGSVTSGQEEVDSQSQAFTIIGYVLGGIGGIALLVAAIGVINTMVMATMERTREIGIMRAIGATKKTVRRLFTVEAGVLGFMGGVFGILLSFVFAFGLNQILNQQLADSGISDKNIVSVSPAVAVVVVAVTTLIGMLAGRLPARRAANLDPVEALRYE